jgi:glutamine synthetase
LHFFLFTTKMAESDKFDYTHEFSEIQELYGKHVFRGAVAAPFLTAQGLPANTVDSVDWVKNGLADKVAAAVLSWAQANNASVFCHWFQPQAANMVRHGNSAQVQMRMFKFKRNGELEWDFSANDLLFGETDGSSYPSGGLRATHTAGGYLVIDPTSPIFLRGDTIFIPSCFVSYNGHCLDEKTPLLRSNDAMSREGTRLLKLLGYNVQSLQSNIGLEQEFFFVPRAAFLKRPDLQLAGRTVLGKVAPRGQEMCDHYMAPPNATSPPLGAMREIQRQAYLMGIPLITRHREVAPGQYEFAPYFGFVTTQIDQNLMLMQIMEEVAVTYGLACLIHEKPFQGVNGSGKHNNWSIGTDDGTNLMNVGQLAKRSGSPDIFPVIMAAVLSGVDEYGDLMRMAIASPGNDFRLGACEAPPAIMSVYLGEQMANYMQGYMEGVDVPYNPQSTEINLGADCLPVLNRPAEDRNRTSPFPYGGHRFEFRAVGSSQNVSTVNTVLSCICAKAFKNFADAIEGGQSAKAVAQAALKKHFKVVFNGNGYDANNQQMLSDRGVWRIDSGVDAMVRLRDPKNVALFKELGVLSEEECNARTNVNLEHYIGTVEIEVRCMIDMMLQHVIPAVRAAGVGNLTELENQVSILQNAWVKTEHTEDLYDKAVAARVLRLETMVTARAHCDAAEAVVPSHLWTLATYKELLFIDQHNTSSV